MPPFAGAGERAAICDPANRRGKVDGRPIRDVKPGRRHGGTLGRSSLGFELVGHRETDDHLCWMAEAVCVLVDRTDLTSRAIPDNLRLALDAEALLAVRTPFADRMLAV